MIKYSQYKNRIFLGFEEEPINEGIFNYLGQLFKKIRSKSISVEQANEIQKVFALGIATNLKRLKFKKFTLYSIIFDLKTILADISDKLISQINKDDTENTNVILKEAYNNNENLLYALEKTTKRIEEYIKREALKIIRIKYPDSKISPNYDSNKKIVTKFIQNFNVIFEPYKKTSWAFSNKVEDVSPFQILANKIVKKFKKTFTNLENLYIKDDTLQDVNFNIDNSDNTFNSKVSQDVGINFDNIRADSKIELNPPFDSYYDYYFKGNTKLDNIIKGAKNDLALLGPDSPEQRNYFVQLSKAGFVKALFRKFPSKLKKGVALKEPELDRVAQKDIKLMMTTLYTQDQMGYDKNNTTHKNYDPTKNAYTKDSEDEQETKTDSIVPKGHEREFIQYLNRNFGIRYRTKLIDMYSKEYGVSFPREMFKKSHELAKNAYKKYLYVYEKDPNENLDYGLLMELFDEEYDKYLKNKDKEETEENETEENETEEEIVSTEEAS